MRAGLGNDTYLPPGIKQSPPETTMQKAREEAEVVMFEAVQRCLEKANVKPREVGILIVNCSLFCPTPSLTAMIVNHFKMRSNIQTYNLSGMGCSAGVISIDLAKDLLQVHPGTYALVVSTENITQNWYFGNDRSMLIPNTLFRVGGAAILLSNRRTDWWRAKYRLVTTVRTHAGAEDEKYSCIFQQEDSDGQMGVKLAKSVVATGGEVLKKNITTLGPMVLPLSEQIIFFVNLILRKLLGKKRIRQYVPNFKMAFEHFCIHTGGRGVIDQMAINLNLNKYDMEPSRETLWRYGNISSSSVWYEMAYMETDKRIRKGDRVWQIAFGSGFKVNSAVWKAMRRGSQHTAWEGELREDQVYPWESDSNDSQ